MVLGLTGTGVAHETVHTLVNLVLSPLWFLLVFAVLQALTPLASRLNPLWPLAVVLVVDLVRFALDGPAWLGWINVAAGWLVPYCLGAAWARGKLLSRRVGWAMLGGGAAATAALVAWCGYPASMVGVPGAAISNLNPPTLAAVTFGIAQSGLALLLLGPLRRLVGQPGAAAAQAPGGRRSATPGQFAWALVALMNLSVITIFLWHQTAMLSTTAVTLALTGPLFGLHTAPDAWAWVLVRLLWVPVFVLLLVALRRAFQHVEGDSRRSRNKAS